MSEKVYKALRRAVKERDWGGPMLRLPFNARYYYVHQNKEYRVMEQDNARAPYKYVKRMFRNASKERR